MPKTANLYARIEPELKREAEEILEALGIPASSAITMFYRQIVMQRGLPFDVKLPPHPLDASKMTKEELDAEIQKGLDAMKAGKEKPFEQVCAELKRDLEL